MYALVAKNCELQNFARVCLFFCTSPLHLLLQIHLTLSQLLLASEIQSVRNYWHLYPQATSETPYPEQAFRSLTSVGNVEDTQSGAWLYVSAFHLLLSLPSILIFDHSFWGAQRLEISGIQMVPFTAITGEYVIDQAWGQAAYTYTSVEFNNPSVGAGMFPAPLPLSTPFSILNFTTRVEEPYVHGSRYMGPGRSFPGGSYCHNMGKW